MLPSAGVYALQGHLYGLFLEHPSPPRGHREQVPHLFAFSRLWDDWVATPPTQGVLACGNLVTGGGGGVGVGF